MAPPVVNLAGYALYYRQDSWAGPQRVDVGNQTTRTLTGLVGGAYSFTVTAYTTAGDESNPSNTVTATIDDTQVNQAPVAQADGAATPAGTAVTITVLANDSDPEGQALSVTAVAQGTHGTVTYNTTTVTYTPQAAFTGTDSFSYTVADSQGATATANVSVKVFVMLQIEAGSYTLTIYTRYLVTPRHGPHPDRSQELYADDLHSGKLGRSLIAS